jgi:nicotinamidase-related amidase
VAAHLLSLWRDNQWPVFHVQHCSIEPNSPLRADRSGNDIKPEVLPIKGEKVFKKSVNSAFIGTDLQICLTQAHINKLVITGLTTDHCVSTTARMAGNLGYETFIAEEATATFPKTGVFGQVFDASTIHHTALASLNREFVKVLSMQELIPLFF